MIVVTYHDDLKEVQGDALSGATTPFDRIEWWQNLQDSCGLSPLIATATIGDQRAMLPLMRRGRSLVALANWYNFTVRPLVSIGSEAEALLAALVRDLAGQSPHLTFGPLPDEGGEASQLERCLRRSGWIVFREVSDTNHILTVAGRSFSDYLASRPGTLRTTLKRKAGKVDVTLLDQFDSAAWAAYEAIYAQSWKPEEGSPAFLRRFASEEAKAGRLRMAMAHVDGEPVAAQFWTVENGTAYIHKLAHTEASKPLSPGTTLSAALFEQVIDRDRVSEVDFGTGDNPYKRDWMDSQRPRFQIEAFRPGWPGNWPRIAKRGLRSLAGSKQGG